MLGMNSCNLEALEKHVRKTYAPCFPELARLDRPIDWRQQDSQGETLLCKAVEFFDFDTLEFLLVHYRELVNVCGESGMTALHKAAFVGSFRAVQMIVATGGNVRASTKLRMTPLHALFDRYFPWVRNFRRMTPWDTLEDVLATDLIEESNFELRSKIFNLLVQEGALLDVKDCRGLTPRMMLQEWQVGQERLRVYHWC
jgi:ankyrin repeat protein